MRLNPDCIRDILFTVEEHTDFSSVMDYPPDGWHEKSPPFGELLVV